MKKPGFRIWAAGAFAAMAATLAHSPCAQAQSLATADRAAAIIKCSIAAEEKALECKEENFKRLEACISQATDPSTGALDQAAVRKCDSAALAQLLRCELNGIQGDGSCWTNPNGGITAAR